MRVRFALQVLVRVGYIYPRFFSAVRFVGSIPSLEPLFFLVWVHGLCFLSPFLLWRFFARFGFRWGFFCTRTTCMFAEQGLGGGFHHPPRCAPWVLPVTHFDRTFVLLKLLLNLSQTSGTQVLVPETQVPKEALWRALRLLSGRGAPSKEGKEHKRGFVQPVVPQLDGLRSARSFCPRRPGFAR